MAPNRKNVSNLLSTLSNTDLASLQESVQPKYLPLTHPQEESKHQEQEQVVSAATAPSAKQQPQTTSASYWDWPTEDIKEEEPVVNDDLFSASRIEANLIKSASAAQAVQAESNTVADHDDYWAEAAEQDIPEEEEKEVIRAPQHLTDAGYWEWSANENETTILRIVADEQARVRTSVESMLEAEKASRRQTSSRRQVHSQKESNDSYWQWNTTKVASHVNDASHPNANYWDWEAKPSSSSSSSSMIVQSIMDYEAARELLKVTTIVQQLQQQKSLSVSSSSSCCGATKASSDDYWNFSEQYGDEYWQEQTPRQPAAAVTTGYWDW